MSHDRMEAANSGGGGQLPPGGEGFETWLAALVPDVRRLGIHLAGNTADAADLAQATCLRALEKRALFVRGTGSDLRRWVGRIMVNLHHDARRRSGWEIPSDWMEEVRAQEPEPAATWKMIDDDDLHAAVDGLRPQLREVYVLGALEGYSYETISAELKIPVATVATRMFRARARLRAALTPREREIAPRGKARSLASPQTDRAPRSPRARSRALTQPRAHSRAA
jgi:RNA polymerase sigma-70 factor (ECF subfamily)